jgi:serine/threonine protein phosphatase PrpC
MRLPGFTYAMASDAGLHRKGNEDFCAASTADGVFVVCDGMGGAAAGEVASRLAAETFLASIHADLSQSALPGVESGVAGKRLDKAIRAANDAVCEEAAQSTHLSGMGTTLVAILLEPSDRSHKDRSVVDFRSQEAESQETESQETESQETESQETEARPSIPLWVAHVGDSRCYVLRDGGLRLLTADHSVVEEQVQAGVITREQASYSPIRHVITRAVGSHDQIEPEVQPVTGYPGDLLLLASDGLNRELTDQQIERCLLSVPARPTREALETGCNKLIFAAKSHGGHDNITVLLVYVQ